MNKKWKTLDTKRILSHPRINVFEDTVKLPSGHVTDYVHFGEMADIATVLAIRDDGRILVVKEYSYPPNGWFFHLPGGLVEKTETPTMGASRELAEEGEFRAKKLQEIGWFFLDNRRHTNRLHVFIATGLTPAVAPKDPEEEFESYWFTVDEIDGMISKGSIVVSTFLSAWAIYKATLNQ